MDGNPRFDTDSTGVKYIIFTASDGAAYINDAGTLTGAMDGIHALSLTLVAALVSLSFN